MREGILQGVVRTGDLMYDCFLQYRQKAKTEALDRLGVQSKQYVLATIHREENADNPQRVQSILRALTVLPLPVIFPVHPRTRPKVEAWLAGGESLGGVRLIGPVGYLEMLALETHARFILTDSEACSERRSSPGFQRHFARSPNGAKLRVAAGDDWREPIPLQFSRPMARWKRST